MKNNKVYMGILLGVLGVGLTGYMATSVIPKVFVSWTRAAPAKVVSLKDSYLIGGKILAKADGVDNCVVNVFVLDESGKGVKDRQVTLLGLPKGEMDVVSDGDGRASFEIASLDEGQFELTAQIGGVPLSKTLKVTFRK